MRTERWLDHLPPWLSLLSLAPTGLFALEELAIMALPLILAAGIEWQGWDLGRWRRGLELGALALLLLMGAARLGLLQLLAYLIFLLSGIRLALPRTLPHRRQILLMGFLVFLMAAMSLPSLDFALWALLWTTGAALCLAHQAWPLPGSRPPLRPMVAWILPLLLIAAACFLGLPRMNAGNRLSAWNVRGFGPGIGLTDSLDLSERGPLRPQTGPVLRVAPQGSPSPVLRARLAQRLALLKGLGLETLEGSRWEADRHTPRRQGVRFTGPSDPELTPGRLEFQLAPTPSGIIPLPYGALALRMPREDSMEAQPGGGVGWKFPPRRTVSLGLSLGGEEPDAEALTLERRLLLTQTGEDTESAHRWSLRVAPTQLPAADLAARLSTELQGYAYTLANPSGRAANPLEDFLERTRAGHCEYFASALACALRSRQVPARVAVGYRLGPWVPEGGYWLVTQNEAHSWVEFYDPSARCWRVADPTPATTGSAPSLLTRLRHLQDALSYRWDRYVLRFSSQDQLAGLDWAQKRVETLSLPSARWQAGALLLATGLGAWLLLRRRAGRKVPGGVRELAPLLARTRRACPPAPGETARSWLKRLAALAPEQQASLLLLADQVDAAIYGSGPRQILRRLAREAARNFSPRPGSPMRNRGKR